MNPERNEGISSKSLNHLSLATAPSTTYDNLMQNARKFYKATGDLLEDLEKHSSIIMTDIFGSNTTREYSHRLADEARREADDCRRKAASALKSTQS